MKNKSIYICVGLILILVISIGLIYPKHSKTEELKSDTNGLLSFYVEKENNVYEKTVGRNWPTEGYVLNEVKSNCENGSVLTWVNNKVQVTGNVSDKCHIYFDKIVKDYDYIGTYQEFTVSTTGTYKIELWGAQGGNVENSDSILVQGGKGAYVSGNIKLEKEIKFYIYVGASGENSINGGEYHAFSSTFNGGGSGHQNIYARASSGGGATDIRLINGVWNSFNSLKSRIMVSAGGGGALSFESRSPGGYGGALQGGEGLINGLGNGAYDSNIRENATGGTQTSGGKTNDRKTFESFGKFGIGGNSFGESSSGGGGGYYGGAGGIDQGGLVSAGAGGSSFISGYKGCVAIREESTEDKILLKDNCSDGTDDIECSYHYSDMIFTETQMIAGNETMPSPSGGTEEGHTGNGYARITYLGK